jgi:uncharacterized protein YciI
MTDTTIPDGVTIETIYIIEVPYAGDAAERRPAVRLEHLTRIARLMDEGRLIEAGGFLDFSGALLLVRAKSGEDAVALIRDDVYIRSGVWTDAVRARAYGRVVRTATKR